MIILPPLTKHRHRPNNVNKNPSKHIRANVLLSFNGQIQKWTNKLTYKLKVSLGAGRMQYESTLKYSKEARKYIIVSICLFKKLKLTIDNSIKHMLFISRATC